MITPVAVDLDVVAAGAVPPNPSEMLSSKRIRDVLADIATRYDYVVVDSAPILPVADSVALSQAVDGVLLVTQANRTSNTEVREALARLDRVGAPMVGLVLNQAKSGGRDDAYGYRYRYGHHVARPDPEPVGHDDTPRGLDRPPVLPGLTAVEREPANVPDDR